jgi:Bacteriophage Mu Gam like protein
MSTEGDIATILGGDPDTYPDDLIPDDELGASRLVHRYAATLAETERVRSLFDAEITRLAERQAELLDDLAARAERLAGTLRLYHQARLREDPKRLTITLPGGTLTSRRADDVYVYDEPAFIAWATAHLPGAVVTPEPAPRIDKRKARALLSDRLGVTEDERGPLSVPVDATTGEIVPGLSITRGGPDRSGRTYTIKPGG